ncbi:AAA domain-containing protein [Corallococcus sp. bb12-1]|uniref:DEAD/DEAH box helicase n=1 Tax=Corallococcus sp. bb12-1 TaxID=2996784 RepID=UPI00226D8AB9|nr:AAA domain-containing protein [Corallococcus sp. bb12-1]MCY1045973.1 AAA domain-containing protein [Corallococcus sp. bb12-1]
MPLIPPLRKQGAPVAAPDTTPERVLDAWTALEVLSPPAFQHPRELAFGDADAIVPLGVERLPWDAQGAVRSGYQVVLGTVMLEAAAAQLLARHADARIDGPPVRGEAPLAVVFLDETGRPREGVFTAVSSHAWGLPLALRGELAPLASWSVVDPTLAEELGTRLRRTGTGGEPLPVDWQSLTEAFDGLVRTLGLPPELVRAPAFAVRSSEPVPLNSPFLADLIQARIQFGGQGASQQLLSYLRGLRSEHQTGLIRNDHRSLYYLRDLPPDSRTKHLLDSDVFEGVLAPERTPPARWPEDGREPLVLMEQAAVNVATLGGDGMTAVNALPGTGGTAVLQDVVAALLCSRAEAMARFDDPASAFTATGARLGSTSEGPELWTLEGSSLCGFEMLWVSPDASPDVGAALPVLKAEASGLGAPASDAGSRNVSLWGLAAEALGDKAPRVALEAPPPSPQEARQQWQTARATFLQTLQESRDLLQEREEVRKRLRLAEKLHGDAYFQEGDLRRAESEFNDAEAARQQVRIREAQAREALAAAEDALAEHESARPSAMLRMLQPQRLRDWSAERARLEQAHQKASRDVLGTQPHLTASGNTLAAASVHRDEAAKALATLRVRLEQTQEQVREDRQRLGRRFVDDAFFEQGHDAVQQSTPWLDPMEQGPRDAVFVAAVALHQAFNAVAAKPLRDSLCALRFALREGLPAEYAALLPQLWSSLFLVAPLVSTTFASVGRLFRGLPPESLGWLLVEDAGQAAPQEAVGALLRTRRAVVVGDSRQLRPVVPLPDALTSAVCAAREIDPQRFNAPEASVQTLANAASRYVLGNGGPAGSRTLGIPLWVHRRCAEPMFGVSNTLAYANLMVHANASAPSRIREVLGPSAWIDVREDAGGERVLALLRRLSQARVEPDVLVITPFETVAEDLRRLMLQSGVLLGWVEDPEAWVQSRVGVVDALPGREAEAVMFVLGASAEAQRKERDWAARQLNLLNATVTRAREQLYVIGSRRLWSEAGVFRVLSEVFSPEGAMFQGRVH